MLTIKARILARGACRGPRLRWPNHCCTGTGIPGLLGRRRVRLMDEEATGESQAPRLTRAVICLGPGQSWSLSPISNLGALLSAQASPIWLSHLLLIPPRQPCSLGRSKWREQTLGGGPQAGPIQGLSAASGAGEESWGTAALAAPEPHQAAHLRLRRGTSWSGSAPGALATAPSRATDHPLTLASTHHLKLPFLSHSQHPCVSVPCHLIVLSPRWASGTYPGTAAPLPPPSL